MRFAIAIYYQIIHIYRQKYEILYILIHTDQNQQQNETYFKFWVAPVTMIFENAHSVKVDIESSQGGIEIADLYMKEPLLTPNGKFTEYTYTFECQEGSISLKATGFKMYVRQIPKLLPGQSFTLRERDGVSFQRELHAI